MENVTINEIKRWQKLEVKIKHSISIENVNNLKDKIIESLDGKKKISIKLQATEKIDISGIQLIYAVQQEAKQKDIDFELLFDGNDEIISLLEKTGFEELLLSNTNKNK